MNAKWQDNTGLVPGNQCALCKHFDAVIWACAAFPDGIPEAIWIDEFDHKNPYPNTDSPTDNGIRFAAIREKLEIV